MKQISHLMASLLLYAPVTCFNRRKKTEAFHVCMYNYAVLALNQTYKRRELKK